MIDGTVIYRIQVEHPLRGWINVGHVYRTEREAQSWRSFVKAAWHGLPVRIKQFKASVTTAKDTQ